MKRALATVVAVIAALLVVPPAAVAADCGSGTFHAEAYLNGSTWTARRGGTTVHTGTDMRAAIGSLTPGRTSKERTRHRSTRAARGTSRCST